MDTTLMYLSNKIKHLNKLKNDIKSISAKIDKDAAEFKYAKTEVQIIECLVNYITTLDVEYITFDDKIGLIEYVYNEFDGNFQLHLIERAVALYYKNN